MPLKNLLRKTKKYDVSSRNAFVVCIHLLNGELMECTLTSESTGQDCLENIAQRIELNEVEYFGLRYVNKKLLYRWLELDKPLKKQLDKNAHSPLVYFNVMYYVPEAETIEDPVTSSYREIAITWYQYYMQLKNDVIDGHLPCTPEQAVLLAAYSVQSEFGDYEEGKHTVEYFKDVFLLPKPMITDEHLLQDRLKQEIVNTHRNLQGVDPQVAEDQYIKEAQQLDSYGLEYYNAKSEHMGEIHLGLSVVGIFVKPHPESEKQTSYFKWADINKIVANKKTLVLETNLSAKPIHFQLDDADSVRYVYKMCMLQRQFCEELNNSRNADSDPAQVADGSKETAFQSNFNSAPDLVQSVEQGPQLTVTEQADENHNPEPIHFQLEEHEEAAPIPHAASYPDMRLPNSQQSQQSSVLDSQMQADLHAQLQAQQQEMQPLDPGQYDSAWSVYAHEGAMAQFEQGVGAGEYVHSGQMNNQFDMDSAQQANIQQYMEAMTKMGITPDTHFTQEALSHQNGYLPGQHLGSAHFHTSAETVQVPQYRPAPDYQVVMAQLAAMAQQQQQQPQQPQAIPQNHIGTSQVYTQPETMAYSQPEMSRTPPTYQQYLQHNRTSALQYSHSVLEHNRPSGYAPHSHYHNNAHPHSNYTPTGYGKPVDRTNSLNIHPTYSMPEINYRGLINQLSASEIQLTDKVAKQQAVSKPPPPYRGATSKSTPDLASQAARLTMASSPELHLEALKSNLRAQFQLDRSIENLTKQAQRMGISNEKILSTSIPNFKSIHTTNTEQIDTPEVTMGFNQNAPPPHQQLYTSNSNLAQQTYTPPQQPQQYIVNGHVAPQYALSSAQYPAGSNMGPQQHISGSGNVGPQYAQYASASSHAIETHGYNHGYGPHNMNQQQREALAAQQQYSMNAMNLQQQHQHYGGSNNLMQQFNGPGSTGNVMQQAHYNSSGNIHPPPQYSSNSNIAAQSMVQYSSNGNIASHAFTEETENEDPSREVFITGPPNPSQPQRTYHPALEQQYTQNLPSSQIFYTNGVDLLNNPANHDGNKIKDPVYQNLPARVNVISQHQLEYGNENPYENLPDALESLNIDQPATIPSDDGNSRQTDQDEMHCLDTTKAEEGGLEPNHSQSSSQDTTIIHPTDPTAIQITPPHLLSDSTTNMKPPPSYPIENPYENPADLIQQSTRKQPSIEVDVSSLHPIASASISLPSSHTFHHGNDPQQRPRSVSTSSQDRLSVFPNTDNATTDVFTPHPPRDRAVSTGSYERLLHTRNEIKPPNIAIASNTQQPVLPTTQILGTQLVPPPNQSSTTKVSSLARQARETSVSSSVTGNDLDVLIPRESTGSSFRQSPTTERRSHYDELDTSRMTKEISPTSSTSSAPPTPKPLTETSMNGSGLSVSRANIIESNDNEQRAPKDERRRALESKLEEGQVFAEFEQIPKKKAKCDDSCATLEQNKMRNRFKDVLPYDSNRVKLAHTKHNGQGYINASHIKMKVGGREMWYIASQGPLENTVQDFWQMVWEQGSLVIAMLTDLSEFGKKKCQRYWPEEKGSKKAAKYGDYQVTLKFINDSGSYITRGLVLRHKKDKLKKERLVWHLQYTDWPDHGCPEDTYGFLAYLDEIESVRRHAALEHSDDVATPVIVHCSAGVGRSGVVILGEVMKACLEHNQNDDIASTLGKMREQRMHLVQTVSQYSFVYKTLITYLKSSRLI